MAEYIDREKLLDEVESRIGWSLHPIKIYEAIQEAPAADVVEVKHGKWYRHDKKIHGDTCYHCSECERMALTDCGMVWELTPYCPFCGAKMEGKKM